MGPLNVSSTTCPVCVHASDHLAQICDKNGAERNDNKNPQTETLPARTNSALTMPGILAIRLYTFETFIVGKGSLLLSLKDEKDPLPETQTCLSVREAELLN